MAVYLRLACSGTTVDLRTGGLQYRLENWQSTVTDDEVTESLGLVGTGSDATIMAAAQAIDEMAESCRLYWEEPAWREPVWFEYSSAGEASGKRALVTQITLQPLVQAQYTPLLGNNAAFFQLTISRVPVWESRVATNLLAETTLARTGGTATLPGIGGSRGARIWQTIIKSNSGVSTVGKTWIGIRPTLYGTGSFVASWPLTGKTNGTDTANYTDGSTAVKRCTFATNKALVKRVSVTVDDMTATTDYDQFIGRYLVLLTYKLSTGNPLTTVGLQLRYRQANDTQPIPLSERFTQFYTSYQTIEMGEISIPADVNSLYCKDTTLEIWAEQIAPTDGTGAYLYLDRLILIPSHHLLVLDDTVIADTSRYCYAQQESDGRQYAMRVAAAGGSSDCRTAVTMRNWTYPLTGGVMVCAFDAASGDTSAKVSMLGYLRHRTFQET